MANLCSENLNCVDLNIDYSEKMFEKKIYPIGNNIIRLDFSNRNFFYRIAPNVMLFLKSTITNKLFNCSDLQVK